MSATGQSVGVLLVSALMLLFFSSKIVAALAQKTIITTLKHFAAVILCFLLHLKLFFVLFLKRSFIFKAK